MRIADHIESYVRSRRAERAISKTRAHDIRVELKRWSKCLRAFDKAKREHVEAEIVRLQESGRKNATIKKKISILRGFAAWAHDTGRLAHPHPCMQIRTKRARDAQHGRAIRYVPLWRYFEVTRHVMARAPWVAAVMMAVPLFGLRPQALIRLRWRDITMARGIDKPGLVRAGHLKDGPDMQIVVPFGSARDRALRMTRRIFRALHGRSARPHCPVFPSYRNRAGWSSVSVLCHEVRRHCDAAGFNGSLYWGRHAAITRLHESETGIGPAMNYAGHERIETQSDYGHSTISEPAYDLIDAEAQRGMAW